MRQKLWYHIMTGLGFLLLLGATLFVALRWREIGPEIPTHFDFSGAPESYSGKSSLLGLMAVSWVMYIAMVVVSFFLQTWNMPGRPAFRIFSFGTAGQSPRALQAAADMLALMRVELAWLFSWLMVSIARASGLGVWFMPSFLAALGVTLLVGIIRCARR